MTGADARSFVLDGPRLEGLELVVAGLLPGVDGYRASERDIADRRLAPRLVIPAARPAGPRSSLESVPPAVGDEVSLCDPDNTPLAVLRVDGVEALEGGGFALTGPTRRLRDPEHGPARPARLHAGVDLANRTVAVFSPGLSAADALRAVAVATATTDSTAGRLDLVAEGTADRAASVRLVHELRDVAESLPGARVHFVPRADIGDADADVTSLVLGGLGASGVLDFRRPPSAGGGGAVVLFTGLSGSGKSTVARALADRVTALESRRAVLLDGDDLRRELASELGFSAEDRHRNLERQAWVAARVAEAGGLAICAPIAPFAASRAAMRAKVEPAFPFIVIHVATPLSVAESRDRKGLYAQARAGLITDFTGIDSPYEEPEDADLRIDTSKATVGECAEAVMRLLIDRGVV